MKITEHVYFYLGDQRGWRSCSNTIVIRGENQIMIDPGTSHGKHLEALLKATRADGISPEKTEEIWFTHIHPDHTQGGSVLAKEFGATIRYNHVVEEILKSKAPLFHFVTEAKKTIPLPESIKRLSRKIQLPLFFRMIFFLPKTFLWIVVFILERLYGTWRYGVIPKVFTKEEIIENDPEIQVLFLPGHTSEETGFYIPKEKVLIMGDLLSGGWKWSEIRFNFPVLNAPHSNWQEALDSLRKIVLLEIEILIPAHGLPIRGKERIEKTLGEIIARMEKEKEKAIKFIESHTKKDFSLDELVKDILIDWPKFISNFEKRAYITALLKSIK